MEKLLLTKRIRCRLAFFLLLTLLWGQNVFAQEVSISGRITESDKTTPLPGVSILEKGTANGTITDFDGNYKIVVKSNDAVLLVSFIGFEPQEISVSGKTTIDITMLEAANELGEVVAIGYGTARKKDLTGSVSSVSGEDLQAIPVASAAEALTGRMAGVQIITTEGSPDAEVKIRIRGGGSITQDNGPLYIVDGFPVETISDIPPSEIQSIDVLKDASSTAIYGSRGANGVVILTTKSGRKEKVSVSYNAYGGISKLAKELNVLEPVDYLKWQYELNLLRDDGMSYYEDQFGSFADLDLYEGMPANNWVEQVYGNTGTIFNHDISINGGSEKFSYLLSYASLTNKAIMTGSDYKRNNIALKLNHQPIKSVDIAFSLRYSNTEVNGGGANEQQEQSSSDSRLRHSVVYSPVPIGTLSDNSDELENQSDLVQPLVATADNDQTKLTKNLNIGASVGWEIIENLKIKSEVGFISYNISDSRFYGKTTYYSKTNSLGMPASMIRDRYRQSMRNTNTLNYDISKLLGDGSKHKLKVLLGQEYMVTKNNAVLTRLHEFPSDFTASDAFNLSSQGIPIEYNNNYSPNDKLMSFFGRANYDLLGKYLISATFRADGSSKFAKENRWGYFPSVSAAWRISEESFMKDISLLNDLKLRLSYGTVGNDNIPSGQMSVVYNSSNANAYRILGLDSYFTTSYFIDGKEYNIMSNPELTWETTVTRNIGLDFGLLKNRLSGSFELYYNTTKDLLLEVPVDGTGYTSQYRNMGETQNQGLEVTLNWVAIDKKDYGLNIGINIGMNRNTINSLGIKEDFGYATKWQSTQHGNDFWISEEGSIGQMFGYVSDGRYEIEDFDYDVTSETYTLKPGVADGTGVVGTLRPGKMKVKDLDGDNVISEDDKKIIGDANPLSTGGFNISARFYGFDLSTAFSWSYGNDIYNANKIDFTTTANYRYRNMLDIMSDGNRWTNMDADGNLVNDPATLAQMNANTTMWSPYANNRLLTDWAVEDGSFLRMNSLTLGYTLPESITSRIKIRNLRFYATCYNVFIITNYSGFDPEVSTRRSTPLSPGVDYSAYPRSRQYIFGLNLSF